MARTAEEWSDRYYEQQANHTEARGILCQERDEALRKLAEVTEYAEAFQRAALDPYSDAMDCAVTAYRVALDELDPRGCVAAAVREFVAQVALENRGASDTPAPRGQGEPKPTQALGPEISPTQQPHSQFHSRVCTPEERERCTHMRCDKACRAALTAEGETRTCICNSGFGMNLSCPIHGVDSRPLERNER